MHFRHWKRREVVTLLGGTEATWPIAAWAQPGKLPIIGRLPDARWRAGIRGTKGARNGNYRHGRYTAEAITSRRWIRQKIREVRALTRLLRDRS